MSRIDNYVELERELIMYYTVGMDEESICFLYRAARWI